MPDLNSLPPSFSTSTSRAMSNASSPHMDPATAAPPPAVAPQLGDSSPSLSPRASISLQAAATMNAGLQREPSRRSSSSSLARNRQSPTSNRRRSQVLMNLQFNDPSVPGPGEMVNEPLSAGVRTASPQPVSHSPQLVSHSPLGGDPHHNRTPSLGELHQELEAEQEAQVNRLLAMIRQQQLQLQQLQSQQSAGQSTENAVFDSSDRSAPASAVAAVPPAGSVPQSAAPLIISQPRSPGFPRHPRSSFSLAQADLQRRSRTPSRGASPRMRAASISADSGDQWVLGGRDESAFYQAETQMLVRENQMLRHRVRELEKQLAELTTGNTPTAHEPTQPSHLTHSTSVSEGDTAAASSSTPTGATQ